MSCMKGTEFPIASDLNSCIFVDEVTLLFSIERYDPSHRCVGNPCRMACPYHHSFSNRKTAPSAIVRGEREYFINLRRRIPNVCYVSTWRRQVKPSSHWFIHSSIRSHSLLFLFLVGEASACIGNSGGCSDLCVNVSGLVQCSCNKGFTLTGDGRTCQGDGWGGRWWKREGRK